MKKIFCIGFRPLSMNGTFFYCFNKEQGPFLSKDISQAYVFMSLESARSDALNLMKYFWANPIEFTIFEGIKKQ